MKGGKKFGSAPFKHIHKQERKKMENTANQAPPIFYEFSDTSLNPSNWQSMRWKASACLYKEDCIHRLKTIEAKGSSSHLWHPQLEMSIVFLQHTDRIYFDSGMNSKDKILSIENIRLRNMKESLNWFLEWRNDKEE